MTAVDYRHSQAANPVPQTARVSQSTAVEMSRAAAEVLAAIQVAQAIPRDVYAAREAMREACGQLGLAQRAFFSFPRGKGNVVTGPTIHLAQELARIWGHVQYGMKQLRVDEGAGETELEAFAWDVQTNTRNSTVVVIPHRIDTKDGPKVLTEARDIYDNNANMGARRMRSAIYRILPKWFTDEAEGLCRETLQRGESGVRFDQRIENAVNEFGRGGIALRRLEEKVGRKRGEWTPDEVADLEILLGSLRRREITRDEAFPPERVTTEEVTGQPAPVQRQAPAGPAPVRPEQLAALRDMYARQSAEDDEALSVAVRIVGRDLAALEDLTADEAGTVIGRLQGIRGSWTEFVAALFALPTEAGVA
ncbi:hypothetical protein MXD62_23010 [Frankia sp. Mgl5]|uniref:hypothetical protein n=1 Tax=Frankia sp. Mgl5 TaxID=2933793 RepID=UPI00200DEEC0|nr:hypothetical protein [Frankia sp. Mgl5]MCK9930000.1 hypothetical protein [Frankia sp. Mgl5]